MSHTDISPRHTIKALYGLHAQACSNTYNIAHTDITCCRYCVFYIMYTGYETGHTHPQTQSILLAHHLGISTVNFYLLISILYYLYSFFVDSSNSTKVLFLLLPRHLPYFTSLIIDAICLYYKRFICVQVLCPAPVWSHVVEWGECHALRCKRWAH